MRATLECCECNEEFDTKEFPFGTDVKCPRCGVWLTTEMDEDYDGNIWAWVTGKSEDQTDKEGRDRNS